MANESPAAVVISVDGEVVLVADDGNRYSLATKDLAQVALLESIYTELRKMNKHLELITDNKVTEGDLEES